MKYRLLVLLFAFGLAGSAIAEAASSQTTWNEDWSHGLGEWTDSGGQSFSCSTAGGILHATHGCNQQAFSKRHWHQDHGLGIYGFVRGQPRGSTPYFCGLALLQDGQVYGQLAVGRMVPPVPFDGRQWISWFNDESGGWNYEYPSPQIDTWHAFLVQFDGRTWYGNTDGVQRPNLGPVSDVTAPLRVDLQGAPLYDDGSECQFGPLWVTGVPV